MSLTSSQDQREEYMAPPIYSPVDWGVLFPLCAGHLCSLHFVTHGADRGNYLSSARCAPRGNVEALSV